MNMETMRLEDLMLQRDIYTMVAELLYHPDQDTDPGLFIECLQELTVKTGLNMDKQIQELSRWVRVGGITTEILQREHARLFVGPFSLSAPPYESFYRDRGRIMGDSTMAVLRCYHESGFDISDECRDVADHVSLELDFLAKLSELELAALERGDHAAAEEIRRKHDRFLTEHLLCWLPSFIEAVAEGAELPYYPAVCMLLNEYIRTKSLGGATTCSSVFS
jgi:putative dimethyl sulfoxide reductase chaperone